MYIMNIMKPKEDMAFTVYTIPAGNKITILMDTYLDDVRSGLL